MINYISGQVAFVSQDKLTILVGGVGFQVEPVCVASFQKGQKIDLFIYMHWNQENGPRLFGFGTELEKRLFLLIIGCSGIGPKIGLAVLNDLGVSRFVEAIQAENISALSSVSGLGVKKAEQLVVQLRRKIADLVLSGQVVQESGSAKDLQKIADLLKSLHYSQEEIVLAMKHAKSFGEGLSFDLLTRKALSFLAQNKTL